jgi:broad specificity phosphatase PhoE
VSALYLFRHAQAGPRHRYDTLSDLGRVQAGSLGAYLVAQKTRFRAVYAGALERQRQTALAVAQAYKEAGLAFPEIIVDPCWNEFDLGAVYTALAPALGEEDPRFQREYEEMMRVIEDVDHAVHRNHSYCDIAIVRAWTENRYPYGGESWQDFRSRIISRVEALSNYASGEKIAVFTSATPIGVWMGRALRLGLQEMWRLAGTTYNTGMTTFRVAEQDLRVFTFNSLPHLPDPRTWTFR